MKICMAGYLSTSWHQ